MSPDGSLPRAVAQVFKAHGLERRRNTWYLRGSEVDVVLNLQTSAYGGGIHYLNVGFWIRALGDERYPREVDCHIRGRAETFATDAAAFHRPFLAGARLDDEQMEILRGSLDRLVGSLAPLTSIAGLRSHARGGGFRDFVVTGPALDLLGLTGG